MGALLQTYRIFAHTNDDHFEINLVARLLNQIYVVPVLPPGYDYDNSHANVMDEPTPGTSASATVSVINLRFWTFGLVIVINNKAYV